MKDLKDVVPNEFYSGDEQPMATTVGEIIDQLDRLPRDLPAGMRPHEVGVRLTVANIKRDDAHLMIETAHEWD